MRQLTFEQKKAVEDLVAVVADEVFSQASVIINKLEQMDRRYEPIGATLEEHSIGFLEESLMDIAGLLFRGLPKRLDVDSKFIFEHARKVLRKN